MRRSGEEGRGLYPTDKYSLYSVDTEERIISVDKGLERCANMLKMLDEETKEEADNIGMQKEGGKKPLDSKEKPGPELRDGRVLSDKLGKKGLREEKQRLPRNPRSGGVSGGVSSAAHGKNSEPEKCMRYYQHHQIRPAASSTPTKPGTKSRTQTRVRNMKEKRACLTPPPPSISRTVGPEVLLHHAGSAEELPHPQANKKRSKVHRRLQTEPGKAPLRNAGVVPPPAQSWAELRATAERNKSKRQASSVSPPGHLPPPPPPLFHPYYGFPCYPPYPFPYYPPPLDWPLEPGEHAPPPYSHSKTDTEALDLATFHQQIPFQYSRPHPLDYYQSYYRDIAKYQKIFAKTRDQPKPTNLGGTAPHFAQAYDPPQRAPEETPPWEPTVGPRKSMELGQRDVRDLEDLDDVLCEMLKSCEDHVHHLRTECRSLLVGVQMEAVYMSLQQCRELLHQQCRKLALSEKQRQSSSTNMLSQVQQLERERSSLIEEMEVLEKLKDERTSELESANQQVAELQAELSTIKTDFEETISNLKVTREELVSIRKFSDAANLELKTKNTALQQHIHSLFKEVTTLKEEKLALARTEETAKEEEQMLKVSLSEKDTQLLHTADQLLGLRQCLAQFVSELSVLDPLVRCGVGGGGGGGALYCVSANSMNRLKSLAEDGNIDRFLSSSSTAVDGIHTYDRRNPPHSPISSTASTLTGSEDSPPLHLLASTQHSSQIQVITPLYSLSSDSVKVGEPSGVPGGLKISSPHVMGHFRSSDIGERSHQGVRPSYKSGSLIGHDRAKTSSPHTPPLTSHQVPSNRHRFPPLKSSPSHSSVDVKSTVTTSSEIDFRNNLASLDADIARLQMQFQVARQSHTNRDTEP